MLAPFEIELFVLGQRSQLPRVAARTNPDQSWRKAVLESELAGVIATSARAKGAMELYRVFHRI